MVNDPDSYGGRRAIVLSISERPATIVGRNLVVVFGDSVLADRAAFAG